MPPPRISHDRSDRGATGRPARTITAPARNVSVCRRGCPNRPAAPEAIHPAARDAKIMTTVDHGNTESHGGTLSGSGGGALESAVLLTVKDLALSVFQICDNIDAGKTLCLPKYGCNTFLNFGSNPAAPATGCAMERGDHMRPPLFDYRLITTLRQTTATSYAFITLQYCRAPCVYDRTDRLTPHGWSELTIEPVGSGYDAVTVGIDTLRRVGRTRCRLGWTLRRCGRTLRQLRPVRTDRWFCRALSLRADGTLGHLITIRTGRRDIRTDRWFRRALCRNRRTMRLPHRTLRICRRTSRLNRRTFRLGRRTMCRYRWTLRPDRRTLCLSCRAERRRQSDRTDCRFRRASCRKRRTHGQPWRALRLCRRASRLRWRTCRQTRRALGLLWRAVCFATGTLGRNRRAPCLRRRTCRHPWRALRFRWRTFRLGRRTCRQLWRTLRLRRRTTRLTIRALRLHRRTSCISRRTCRQPWRTFRQGRRTLCLSCRAVRKREIGRTGGRFRRAPRLSRWTRSQPRRALGLLRRTARFAGGTLGRNRWALCLYRRTSRLTGRTLGQHRWTSRLYSGTTRQLYRTTGSRRGVRRTSRLMRRTCRQLRRTLRLRWWTSRLAGRTLRLHRRTSRLHGRTTRRLYRTTGSR